MKETIRSIRTIGDNYPVYRDAEVEIKYVDPNDVYPISRYVLRDNLAHLHQLKKEMEKEGENLFGLSGVVYRNSRAIAPPVIENDGEKDCIVDGLHRLTIAKIKGERVKVIYVSGADQSRPIIGKPVEWEDVKIKKVKPEIAKECRDLRVPDNSEDLRKCYRDLSVLGSSGRRPRGGQEN